LLSVSVLFHRRYIGFTPIDSGFAQQTFAIGKNNTALEVRGVTFHLIDQTGVPKA